MKKLLLILFIILFPAAPCFPGTTASDKPVGTAGVVVTITAVADASGVFEPILFDESNNAAVYKRICGRWLTSARTTFGTIAPSDGYDMYIIDGATSSSEHVLAPLGLAMGSDPSAVATGAFPWVIDMTAGFREAVAAGTEPGDDVVPQGSFGAVALDMGVDGTIDAIEAAGNATGYASAILAIAGVAPAASDHVRLGYVTASKSDSTFVFGTTALNAANTTVGFYSTPPAYDIMGGRMTDRPATVPEEVYPANTAGDNTYYFVGSSLMVLLVNNSVASAAATTILTFN